MLIGWQWLQFTVFLRSEVSSSSPRTSLRLGLRIPPEDRKSLGMSLSYRDLNSENRFGCFWVDGWNYAVSCNRIVNVGISLGQKLDKPESLD